MELHEALTQIAEIRQQMARTAVFRGYRALPVAFSGLLAFGAAAFQGVCLPNPLENLPGYLILWIGAALVGAFAAGTQMVMRCRRSGSAWSRDITWLAIEQFLPCMVAGGLVTLVLVLCAPESVWLLPGLWQVLFSLGIFASYRLLPRTTFFVGLFYLVAGIFTLALARGDAALSPLAMGLPFGVGQLAAAAVLYWALERNDGDSQE